MPEENVEELKEKLSKMSPEELREFQKKNCIFCHIMANKVQSKKIFEDEIVCAILDINPANPGHILLLPKEHYAIMPQMPDDVVTHLAKTAKHLSKIVLRSLKAEGTTILVANGVAAGQKAQHFMLHIIPRMQNDGLTLDLPYKIVPMDVHMKIKRAVQPNIYKVMGLPFTPEKPDEVEMEKPRQVRPAEIKEKEPEMDIMSTLAGEGPEEEPEELKEEHGAEPEEQQEEGQEASRPRKPSRKKPAQPPAKKHDTKEEKKEIDLDDIANLFG